MHVAKQPRGLIDILSLACEQFFAKNYPENMLEVWDHQFKWIEKVRGI